MSARRTTFAGLVALSLGSAALAGCGGDKPYQPVKVAAEKLDHPVTIGVVYTSTSDANEGADYAAAAAGARVAAYRIGLKGDDVHIVAVDDHGTDQGAADAASVLAGKKVDAVVYASSGSHVDAAVEDIASAGTCVVLPYADVPAGAPDRVWSTGPSGAAQADALAELIAHEGFGTPLVVTDGSLPDEALKALGKNVETRVATRAADLRTVHFKREDAKKAGAQGSLDPDTPVVVWADASTSATLLATIQGAGHTGPTILGPAALTPAFNTALGEISTTKGTVSSVARYLAAGEPTTATGGRGAGFTAAQQIVSQDAGVHQLASDEPLAAGAYNADPRSHDAVVALVAAARVAGKAPLCDALKELKVTGRDGLAGPDLDFASSAAYPASDVVELQAALSRRADETQGLVWFAVPDEKDQVSK